MCHMAAMEWDDQVDIDAGAISAIARSVNGSFYLS